MDIGLYPSNYLSEKINYSKNGKKDKRKNNMLTTKQATKLLSAGINK